MDTRWAMWHTSDPMFMSVEEKALALLALSTTLDRLDELRMRVLVAADDVAAQDGARDAAAWLAHQGRRNSGDCRRSLRLARALAERASTAGALRRGEINVAQAAVVVRVIDDLPADIDNAVRSAAEDRLVDEAGRFGPRALRVLGRRVVDVVAPEVSDELEDVGFSTKRRRWPYGAPTSRLAATATGPLTSGSASPISCATGC